MAVAFWQRRIWEIAQNGAGEKDEDVNLSKEGHRSIGVTWMPFLMDEGSDRRKGTLGDNDNHASVSGEENTSEDSGATASRGRILF